MPEKFTIHDISPRLSPRLAVFPGDQPFERRVAMAFEQGHALGLSALLMTAHSGAHVDAPSHYHPRGEAIDQRELDLYLGLCQVIQVRLPRGARIRAGDLGAARIQAPRILFRTDSYPDPDRWNADFNSLSPELVERLADQGVRLVGIDTPSVDPAESKALEAHQALFARDIANLEGIVLTEVLEGLYTLIALPLRIEGGDASPVRAVLLKERLS